MFVVGAAVGQTEDKLRCIGKPIDSVRVNFISLAEDFLDVTLVADKETLSFFKKKHIRKEIFWIEIRYSFYIRNEHYTLF